MQKKTQITNVTMENEFLTIKINDRTYNGQNSNKSDGKKFKPFYNVWVNLNIIQYLKIWKHQIFTVYAVAMCILT